MADIDSTPRPVPGMVGCSMSDIDLRALSQRYGRVFANCSLVVPGANRTYSLTADDNAYYLRLYRPTGRSAAEIRFEMRLLHEVRLTPGIDVARPIPTVDGQDCARVPFDGVDRVAGLFHALDGRPIADAPEDVVLFGSALAQLHGLSPRSKLAVRVHSILQHCAHTPSRR